MIRILIDKVCVMWMWVIRATAWKLFLIKSHNLTVKYK